MPIAASTPRWSPAVRSPWARLLPRRQNAMAGWPRRFLLNTTQQQLNAYRRMPRLLFSGAGHHISKDAPARINRFCDRVVVIARNDNHVAGGVDAANHTDMAAARSARHHRDSADPRTGNPLSVRGERFRHIRGSALMTATLQHQVHEGSAPKAPPLRRISAEMAPRLRDDGRVRSGRRGMSRRCLRGYAADLALRLHGYRGMPAHPSRLHAGGYGACLTIRLRGCL